ncbi:MAG: MMPL family transporter [Candidatus Rokubacteria bacterium]|nr:MMPL family transporter [Candidatus Rokubacteria bacterium]
MRRRLVLFSVDRPRLVLVLTLAVTLLFASQFPRIRIDTDPENMLEADQPDRVFYRQVKKEFGIHDMLVVGLVDPAGVYRPEVLERYARIVDGISRIKGVVLEDLLSLTSTDDVRSSADTLSVRPIMERVPGNADEMAVLRMALAKNPLFADKLADRDGKAFAIYVPIQAKDQSHRISKEIEAILAREQLPGQSFHIAGLPVAEDTFGFEMFLQMAVTAPLAMGFIFLLLLVLFRRVSLILIPMGVAMASVLWTMGALIGSGFTVHIMSSMIPVFLMPIAVLDSVHILSDFYEHYRRLGDMRRALLETMDEVFTPCLYTSLTSAVGFGSLAMARIPPVQVFGAFTAFGIMAAWVLTFTFIPAAIVLIGDKRLRGLAQASGREPGIDRLIGRLLPGIAGFVSRRAGTVLALGVLALVVAVWGVGRIRVNDNPVNWFKPSHKIRVADRVMNERFGGTYMASLVVDGGEPEAIKRPHVMGYIERLQGHLERTPPVGKTSSAADIVKRVDWVLRGDADGGRLPDSEEAIGQELFLFLTSGKPTDLDNFLDSDYRKAHIWVQLKRGDNVEMERVERAVGEFARTTPPPPGVALRWSGLTYINVVWQKIMVRGMLEAVLGSFVFVFLLMVWFFRSATLGLVSMAPLTVAILFSYGLVGLTGKDYDMPVAVCASLSLGLAIDLAIHYLQRFRTRYREVRDLDAAQRFTFGLPMKAITRNAIVVTLGFLPLVFSTLTPYVTVGVFFALLMAWSFVATLLFLPALVTLLGRRALGRRILAGEIRWL